MAIGANFGITGKGQFVYYQDDYVNHHPEVGNSILKDVSKVNKDGITSLGATGIVEIDNQLKIIFGKDAKELKKCIDDLL